MSHHPLHILLFEDNPADVFIVREVLKTVEPKAGLQVATDGVEGLAILKKEGKYANSDTPDLIVLDLNMPKKDGHEVLAEIKEEDGLKETAVAILTNSQSPHDTELGLKYSGCRVFNKPATFTQMIQLFEEIIRFATAK